MSSGCFNALLMPQEPIEAGTDYTEKEVNKLFTTQRGCSVSSLHRLKGNESIGRWLLMGKDPWSCQALAPEMSVGLQ